MKKKGLRDIKRIRIWVWTLNENVWENTAFIDSSVVMSLILLIDAHDFNSNYDLIRP